MSQYTATIGLEVHVELKTATKMFCSCKNDPDETRPNWNVCPICMAHPGTLPVPNKEAIRQVLRVGTALSSTLADFTEWDRKNYFYPDIPKGYQISQYAYPLVTGGALAGVEITRVHLEEDTGSSMHDQGDFSLVDYNRAGVPLMELVTEPVIHDAETAMRFAKELQLLMRYLGASDANMEKGQMRIEANISISDTTQFGTKVEVKNINSFKSVGDAITYELKRQEEELSRGEKVVQETRGKDQHAGKTFSQRKKESANDYRYFPDPDIPKLRVSEVPEFTALGATMPELPWERRMRLRNEFGFADAIIEMFVTDLAMGDFFVEVVARLGKQVDMIKLASNYLTSDFAALAKAHGQGFGKVTVDNFTALIHMVNEGTLSSRGAKDTLAHMYLHGGDANAVAVALGVIQKNDTEALKEIVREVVNAHQEVVAEYRAGKTASLQYLVGQGMKASRGAANPKVLTQLFQEMIGS